jgi:Domain of unknown function (DUF5047)
MYPASAALKAAIREDHIAVTKAEIWNQDQKLLTLDITDGSVQVLVGNAFRRSCSVSLTTSRETNNLVPDTDFDFLTPFGNEIRLFRGVEFTDGTREYVPLGIFVITDIKIRDENNGVFIDVDGVDRGIIVSRNKWTEAYQMVSGTLESSIQALLQDRYTDVQVNFPTTNVTINQVILGAETGNDPWKDAVEICELGGYDLFFDVDGKATMRQFPSLDGSPIVAIFEEGEQTIITNLTRDISSRDTYNGIIYTIEGSNVTTPVRVEVWDEDPASPTYRYGVFGEAPTFVTANLLATQAEVIQVATVLLNKYIGAQEQISFGSLVDPTLDSNDVVYVKSLGAKVDRLVIIDDIRIPLSPSGQMETTTRAVRVVGTNEIISVGA